MKRLFSLPLILSMIFAACGGGGDTVSGPTGGTGGGGSGTIADGPSRSAHARNPMAGGNFLDVLSFPFDAITSGCAGADCIPALTDPDFVSVGAAGAGYLRDHDIVMGIVIDGEARAYPHNIGWWHEIINDTAGDESVIVTLCPLTGTGMVFDGAADDGERIHVGVSGLLFNNNLIMYDRRDRQSLYPQMIYKGIQGPRLGEELELLPVTECTWEYWKRIHPDTKVIDGNGTRYPISQYTQYPYFDNTTGDDYRTTHSYINFPNMNTATSDLFGAKDLAMGVRFGDMVKAYPFQAMHDEDVINDVIVDGANEHPILVVHYRDAQLAIPFSREINVNGQATTLTFERVTSTQSAYPFLLKDKETGTTWNLKGEGVAGTHEGKKLTQLPSHYGFWFAWGTFWQNLGIH
jgi:hypothetical protein